MNSFEICRKIGQPTNWEFRLFILIMILPSLLFILSNHLMILSIQS